MQCKAVLENIPAMLTFYYGSCHTPVARPGVTDCRSIACYDQQCSGRLFDHLLKAT